MRKAIRAGITTLTFWIFLVAALVTLTSCASPAPGSSPEQTIQSSGDQSAAGQAANPEEVNNSWSSPAFEAADIMAALLRAYPHRITAIARRDGDWALQIDQQWLYYANGRFLPEKERRNWQSYDPIPFYRYPKGLPDFVPPSGELREFFETLLDNRKSNPPRRHPGLYNALWQGSDRQSTYAQVKSIYFLGHQTQIHRDLLSVLASVEAEILAAASQDPALQAYIDGLATVSGYYYREIATTSSLSFHAYGAAIDLLPQYYNRLSPYWLWASEHDDQWYDMPYESAICCRKPS